jgi:gluconate kinase
MASIPINDQPIDRSTGSSSVHHSPIESMESDSDDASMEGHVSRMLFQADECSDEDSPRSSLPCVVPEEDAEEEHTTTTCIMNITIAHKAKGASIAEMLWPAAQYLANYILEFMATPHQSSLTHDTCPTLSKQSALDTLSKLLSDPYLGILELGAGLGLTGIKLATVLPCPVLLTDLDVALPLLHQNIHINAPNFLHQQSVQAQRLDWGNIQDSISCYHTLRSMLPQHSISSDEPPISPKLLLLASDCVYFTHLHEPLEFTIAQLLSQAPVGSLCLLAGERRWKRDTYFYSHIGKRSRTPTHELVCTCLKEQTTPRQVSTQGTLVSSRCIQRIYAIQWVARSLPPHLIVTPIPPPPPIHYYVVFGKPGAGKSTVTQAVVQLHGTITNPSHWNLHWIDLDICIPSWMKDHFAKGIYPTLQQRLEFAERASDYVHEECSKLSRNPESWRVILSFSFVNSDVRQVFRIRFPQATWILLFVSDATAQDRIDSRSGHFYSGAVHEKENGDSEWEFAPVDFEHILLDGMQPIHVNAQRILDLM